MKIQVRDLKRLLHEQLLLEDGGQNLGQLLDSMAQQFSAKMSQQYPQAGDAIQREAAELKTQLTATIKAAAAKVKMAASGAN